MLDFLAKRWLLLAMLLGVVLTVAFPWAVEPVTRFFEPRLVIAVALFLMAYTMPSRALLNELASPWAALWAIVISYGFVPAGGWLLGLFAPLPDLRIGLMLVASVPCTLASAVLWTRLAGGNEATALLTTMGTTFLSWGATTLWLTLTTGASIDFDSTRMMLDLVLTLIVPVGLGQLLRMDPRMALVATKQRTLLGVVSQLLILSIILKTAASVGGQIQDGTTPLPAAALVWSAVLSVALHLAALLFGFWSSLGFDRPRRIAVAISCSQKTLPVSLFLFEKYYRTSFPLAVIPLLFFHVGQLILDTFIADRLAQETVPVDAVPPISS